MSRILLAWEIGSGYGHTSRLARLARALAERGHAVTLALRDTGAASLVFAPGEFRTFQTPLFLGNVGGLPPAINHAEMLIRFGFLDPASLAGVARAWRAMIDAVEPELIVLDHAPTGLLATHGTRTRRAVIGDGFCVPPRTDPWPAFRWWVEAPRPRLEDATRRVLAAANQVLAEIGAPRLDRLSDLYAVDEQFLITLAEIDHYPGRDTEHYWGPVHGSARTSMAPRWPIVGDKRVFAYLDPGAGYFEPLVRALQQAGTSTLVFAPGISARAAATLSTASLTISPTAFDMGALQASCDAAVTQAGVGTATALLLAGKPQLMIPTLTERGMLAKRIAALGAGLLVEPDPQRANFRTLLRRLLDDPSIAAAARTFADGHGAYDPDATARAIADRCEALIATRDVAGAPA